MPYLNVGLLLLLFLSRAAAQTLPLDSSFVAAARSQAIAAYTQAVRAQAHVYEGHEYIAHDYRIKVHPYYRIDSLQVGTVMYNGVQYENVQMLYDIVRDEVAVQPLQGAYRLRLRNDHIAAFTIGPYRFTRITAEGAPTGFYEVLYSGSIKALARRVKTVHEDISQGFYKADYRQKDRFFILKDNVYHEIKSKRALLGLFPEQSKALRKYMRANSLKFKESERERAVAQLARQYDELRGQ